MSNEDMSDIIQKLSSMMNNLNSNNNSDEEASDSEETSFNSNNEYYYEDNENQDSFNNFQFDFDTIMKIKTIMDRFNSTKNSPETNLLLSLKPYLNTNRKQKIDQYIQFLKIAKVLEAFNSNGEVNIK